MTLQKIKGHTLGKQQRLRAALMLRKPQFGQRRRQFLTFLNVLCRSMQAQVVRCHAPTQHGAVEQAFDLSRIMPRQMSKTSI